MTGEPSGGAFIGAGSADRLLRSILTAGQVSHVAVRSDGVIVFASANIDALLATTSEEIVGTSVLDWLHPDDAERALLQLTELNTVGSAPGVGAFRVRRADGSYVDVEAMGSTVTDGSADELMGIWLRDGSDRLFLDQLLDNLVDGMPRAEALAPVCGSIPWREFGSSMAISWIDQQGAHQVSTGVPDELGGATALPGSPWATARASGTARQGTAADLTPELTVLAHAHGLGAYWVEPVAWTPGVEPATITIWTAEGPRAPAIHAYGMGVARRLVEIVLRWTDQVERLDRAARSDPLTELANRREFLDVLSATTGGGAVLYCDLDQFKPVNDDLGHFAGDALLRLAARRLQGCVREGDLVGRIGGDEFAVLCTGIAESQAMEVADRMLGALRRPYRLGGAEVRIDASIGVAVSATEVNEELLVAADRALTSAKSGGKGQVVVAPPA